MKTFYLWDESKIIVEYNNSGARTKRYAYLSYGLSPIQVADSNDIYSVHQDQLMTPRVLTNSTQTVVWSQSQKAFGEMVVDDDPDGDGSAIKFDARFPGQWADSDSESGLYYNYFRDYDASTGRYIESDPFEFIDSKNLYIYVTSNPVNRFDFLGLYGEEFCEDTCDGNEPCSKACQKGVDWFCSCSGAKGFCCSSDQTKCKIIGDRFIKRSD
ncbi:MAG: RHS repeat-associated core domain-containing protein [Pseudomonadales bacterium]